MANKGGIKMKELAFSGYDMWARMMGAGEVVLGEVFPEVVEEQQRLAEKSKFIKVDDLPTPGDEETLRSKLEKQTTAFLRKHRHVCSSDEKPIAGATAPSDCRQHPSQKPVLRHKIFEYKMARIKYRGRKIYAEAGA